LRRKAAASLAIEATRAIDWSSWMVCREQNGSGAMELPVNWRIVTKYEMYGNV
jgi:hypothetical protein